MINVCIDFSLSSTVITSLRLEGAGRCAGCLLVCHVLWFNILEIVKISQLAFDQIQFINVCMTIVCITRKNRIKV